MIFFSVLTPYGYALPGLCISASLPGPVLWGSVQSVCVCMCVCVWGGLLDGQPCSVQSTQYLWLKSLLGRDAIDLVLERPEALRSLKVCNALFQ